LTLQPFGNHLVALDMTGEQLLAVLEQQWPREGGLAGSKILKTSGLRYSWDETQPASKHVRTACDGSGTPIDPKRHYRVAVSDFLAAGGDDFTVLTAAGP
jgi:2',3'-cyclic-nucleotide 2'-phosphodiesterase (5'-nucleotidase family)